MEDSVFSPMKINPTLRFNGYTVHDMIEADEVFFDDVKPRKFVENYIENNKIEAEDVVYHYWWGRTGVCSIFMTVGYK